MEEKIVYTLADANCIIAVLAVIVIILIVMGYYILRSNKIIRQRNEQLRRILTALDDYRAIVGDGVSTLDEQEELLNDKLSKAIEWKDIQEDNFQNFFVKMDARINKEKPFTDPNFDQEALIKFMGVSRETFCQLVPRYKDPDRTLDYINSLRAEYAAKLLMEHADCSAEEIVRWCGFKNVAAYKAAFKFSFGIIPTEYVNCISQLFKNKV
jgi:AraC-like DNA-binding protein